MNKQRRAEVQTIVNNLNAFKEKTDGTGTNDDVDGFIDAINSVQTEEEETFENLPEGLQVARQDSHDEIIGWFDEATQALDEIDVDMDDLDEGEQEDRKEENDAKIDEAVAALENML